MSLRQRSNRSLVSLSRPVFTTRRLLAALPAAALALPLASPASAVDKDWNAGDGNWNVASNWAPLGVPGSNDDAFIGRGVFPKGSRVTLNINDTVDTMSILDGELDTGDFEFTLDSISISGANAELLLKANNGGALDSLDSDFVDVTNGGTIRMIGGRLEADGQTGDGSLDVLTGSTLIGYGNIDLEDVVASNSSRFTLSSSTLSVGNTVDGIIIPLFDTARTLTVNATDVDTTADLDQGGAAAVINLLPAGTLDLNIPIVPASDGVYNGTMNLNRRSVLDVEDDWNFSGVMNINTTAGFGATQTAAPTTLRGGDGVGSSFIMSGGSINLNNAADQLTVDLNGQFTTTGGTLNFDAGVIQFDSPGNIGSGTDFDNGVDTTLILNATLTVNDADWDWDGDGGSDSIIQINDTGQLNANITAAGTDDTWNGRFEINGGNLSVNADNNEWQHSGTTVIGGTTLSRILGDKINQDAGSITVNANANLDVAATNEWDGGSFIVNGSADLNGATTWAGTNVTGSGDIQQDSDAVVTQSTTINVDTYDMDGNTGPNVDITINPVVTFTINSNNLEQGGGAFNGNVNINSGTFNVNSDWELGTSGNILLNNTGGGTPAFGGTGEVTVASGAEIAATGVGTLNADVILEEGAEINLNTSGSSINSTGTLTLDGGDITKDQALGVFTNSGGIVVTGASSVDVSTFDWDQSSTTVNAGGNLDINVTTIDALVGDQYDATLNMNGGIVNVDIAGAQWDMDGNLNSNGGGSVFGDQVRIGDGVGTSDANVNVNSGVLNLGAPVVVLGDADFNVAAGATLNINNANTLFIGGGTAEFTGQGLLRIVGADFANAQVINMTGGTVALDGALSNNGGFVLTSAGDNDINTDLTINAAAIEDYGFTTFLPAASSELNIANAATLTINLDNAASEWTVISSGIINYDGDAGVDNFLAGSDLNMNGTLNVDGDGRSNARLDIGGTVNALLAGQPFRLGGGTIADPNTLNGGTINGPGLLGADSAHALAGNGTINANIDFDGTAELIAEDGLLDVNGTLIDMGTLRSRGATAVLDIAQSFNSSVTSNGISLQSGGRIQGAGIITLDVRNLRGNGTVLSRVVNNNSIRGQGGILTINNGLTDIDGTGTQDGLVIAESGDVHLINIGDSSFNGVATINAGRELFQSDNFSIASDGVMNLNGNGATFRTDTSHAFNGTLNVNANGEIDTDGGATVSFNATSTINANATLTIDGTALIDNLATVGGGGGINVANNGTLLIDSGSSINTLLTSSAGGDVEVGTTLGAIANINVQDYDINGTHNVDLNGTALSDYDRTGVAGTLDLNTATDTLDLDFNFAAALGNQFTVFTAASILGTFDNVDVSGLGAGLDVLVNYNPLSVVVEIINAVSIVGDYNGSGLVEQGDLNLVLNNWGQLTPPIPAGWVNDFPTGIVDQAELNKVLNNWGDTTAPDFAGSAVPEPGSAALLAAAGLGLMRRRRSA